MPELGDVKKGYDVGKNFKQYVVWVACERCGKERWVIRKRGHPASSFCSHCGVIVGRATRGTEGVPFGENHYRWKGGYINQSGYKIIPLLPNSPYILMARKDRSIAEHRLVMAQSLGRILLANEVVHHINGDKTDNRIENLELYSPGNHSKTGNICRYCELRKEIRLLRWQIKEQSEQIRQLTSNLMGIE